jgi:predicted metal-dependent phosphoesterase TrpH
MKADFHIHSCFSEDGRLRPEEIVDIARKRGLQVIAVTDHNTITGGLAAKACAPKGLEVIVGAEILTDQGEVIGLWLSKEIQSRALKEVVREIHEQGGKVYIPHPFDRLRKSALRDAIYHILPEIDFIETFNGRCLFPADNVKAKAFACRYRIPELKGSDAHFAFEIGNVFPGPRAFTVATIAHTLTVLKKYSPIGRRRKEKWKIKNSC